MRPSKMGWYVIVLLLNCSGYNFVIYRSHLKYSCYVVVSGAMLGPISNFKERIVSWWKPAKNPCDIAGSAPPTDWPEEQQDITQVKVQYTKIKLRPFVIFSVENAVF